MQKMLSKSKSEKASFNFKKPDVLQVGFNDLATVRPDLADEWNYEKNNGLTNFRESSNSPSLFLPGSGKKVWWKCSKCGYEWQSRILNRAVLNAPCLRCSDKVVVPGRNDLQTRYPEIAKEWNYEKNGDMCPSGVMPGSHVKVWWKCAKGHEYQSVIYSRVDSKGCPYCSGRVPIIGENDLATLYPDIANEWHPIKNLGLKDAYGNDISIPDKISSKSKVKVWWLGTCGHEWQAVVYSRTGKQHSGCPYCDNKKVLIGFNDLQTKYPEIAKEWHPIKNGNLCSCDVLAGSTAKFWWQCNNGHEWNTSISNRTSNGSGCPYCSGNKKVEGVNDFATLHPEMLSEWDYVRNTGLTDGNGKDVSTPDKVGSFSKTKVFWECPNGHSYQSSIANRVLGKGCPICQNKKLLSGFNDLVTRFPDVAKEWNYEKNAVLKDRRGNDISVPENIMPGSNVKVWWKCLKGHEWQATPSHRTSGDHTGCPICSKEIKTSLPEQVIYYYFKQFFPDAINNDRTALSGLELDVYIPSIKVGIEHDGKLYHNDEDKDNRKINLCKARAIKLYRIRECGASNTKTDYDFYYSKRDFSELRLIIKDILLDLGVDIQFDVDINKDIPKIYGHYVSRSKEKSLLCVSPEVCRYWNYKRNNNVNPENVSFASNFMFWWECPVCGHEWMQRPVDMRAKKSISLCPSCSGYFIYHRCVKQKYYCEGKRGIKRYRIFEGMRVNDIYKLFVN